MTTGWFPQRAERKQILTRSEKRQMERAKENHVADLMRGGYDEWNDVTDSPAVATMRQENDKLEKIYVNGMFIVQVYSSPCEWGDVKRVMIRWNDARPKSEWALFQRIKNDLFGPERVAIEVYPAESNKQDVANIYWLFLLPEGFNLPIEWKRS